MARKNIPLKDVQLVKQRLARGASTREAIRGTVIRSNRTAANIAKRDIHKIAQMHDEYLEDIRGFGADDIKRAKLWAEMTRATKPCGKGAAEYPDWQTHLKALTYIDSLAGLNRSGAKINSVVQVGIHQSWDRM